MIVVYCKEDGDKELQEGGFFLGADDVVQAYKLPKYQHIIPTDGPSSPMASNPPSDIMQEGSVNSAAEAGASPTSLDLQSEAGDQDDVMEDAIPPVPLPQKSNGRPIPMHQLAEIASRGTDKEAEGESDEEHQSPNLPIHSNSRATAKASATLSRQLTGDKTKGKNQNRSKRARYDSDSSASDPERPSPLKRGREAAVTSTPTRVLRPRASKSATIT
jgi:xeroderma pigmentosum group C-complementing protein